MNRSWTQLLPWMTAFAVAMGFLESAVVVYLRALYYPEGFALPLAPIDLRIGVTELVREACTLVMLLAPGALLSRSKGVRFAWFCYCFGVWDIAYYVFLKAILGWPASILDWDILFLLPVVWVGPVLAPCLISVGLILVGLFWLRRGDTPALPRWTWVVASIGVLVMLWTFIEGPVGYLNGTAREAASFAGSHGAGATLSGLRDYVPDRFSWALFLLGLGLSAVLPFRLMRRVE